MKKLKSGIRNNKLKDFTFNLDYKACHKFLKKFGKGKVGMDSKLFLADALASAIHRPMIFIPHCNDMRKDLFFNSTTQLTHIPHLWNI
jgi:hypothetical protein